MSWYKLDGERIVWGESVYAPGYTLTDQSQGIDGWRWFDTAEEALTHWSLPAGALTRLDKLDTDEDRTISSLVSRVARIEVSLWPADPEPEPGEPVSAPTMADRGGVWPQGTMIADGGKVWRNISGVPLTTPPSGFPGAPSQWGHLFVVALAPGPDPEPEPEPGILAWAIGQTVTAGDKRTHNGRIWEAKLAHTTHEGWAPSASAYAVWTDIGPA